MSNSNTDFSLLIYTAVRRASARVSIAGPGRSVSSVFDPSRAASAGDALSSIWIHPICYSLPCRGEASMMTSCLMKTLWYRHLNTLPLQKVTPEKSWLSSSIQRKGNAPCIAVFTSQRLSHRMRSTQRAHVTKGDGAHGKDRTVAHDALWTVQRCCWHLCRALWPAQAVPACLLHCTQPVCAHFERSFALFRIRVNRGRDFLNRGHRQSPAGPRFFVVLWTGPE